MIHKTSFQINSICSIKTGLQGYVTLYMATQDASPPAKSIKAFDFSTLYIGISHLRYIRISPTVFHKKRIYNVDTNTSS